MSEFVVVLVTSDRCNDQRDTLTLWCTDRCGSCQNGQKIIITLTVSCKKILSISKISVTNAKEETPNITVLLHFCTTVWRSQAIERKSEEGGRGGRRAESCMYGVERKGAEERSRSPATNSLEVGLLLYFCIMCAYD